MILEGLRNFGGGLNTPPPPRYASDYIFSFMHIQYSIASILKNKAPECESVPLFLPHFEVHNVWNFGSTPPQILTVHTLSTRIAMNKDRPT